MKLAVIGSRTYSDAKRIEERIHKFLAENSGVMIVTGGAEGADTIAEQAARKLNIPVIVFHADWKKFGRGAGPIRNKKIAEEADCCIAFIDKPIEKSRGTNNAISEFRKRNKPVEIIGD